MFPKAGGVYEFSKQAYGNFVSFEVGWLLWIINNIAIALLTVAAVSYLLPNPQLAIGTLTLSPEFTKVLVVVAIIVAMNLVALWGANQSAKLMLLLALFTVLLFLAIIIPGTLTLHMGAFHAFSWHWPAILAAAFLLSETFFGWESVSFLAEEIKDPERTVPRALNMTTAFVAVCSVLIAIITMTVLGDRLGGPTIDRPMTAVLEGMGISGWLLLVANIGVVLTFLGNAVGSVIGNPRLLMALSRDKLFIEQFADIHPRFGTPYRAIALQTCVAVLVAILASGAYERLLELLVAPSITLYAATLVLVPYLRWRKPEHARPYKAPFGRWLPLALVVFFLGILIAWTFYDGTTGHLAFQGNPNAFSQLRLLASFMLLSAPVYLLLTFFYNPDVIVGTINRFAFINLWLENLLVPRRVRREVLELIPDLTGKHLVELGASVGSLTSYLAEHVGSGGRVYAIDLSEGNVRILRQRMERLGHAHVRIIHDPHLVSRIHPDVERVDAAVGIGHLSYAQDVRKMLKDLAQLLPEHGKVCFVEYADMFWFLPNNPKWICDPAKIREEFAQAGFAVNVRVRRGLFWKYVFIYGVKDKRGVPFI
jgi:amino acid transporter